MSAVAGAPVGVDREYETIYVLRPDVEKKRAEEVSSRMTDVIGKQGGKLTRVENWGRRLLAYPVERYKRGVYVYFRYIGHGELVSELERNLRMLDSVIKFQTVKLAELVSADAVSVADDEVKFEHVELPTEEEEDISLARSLGLEDGPDEGRGEAETGEGAEAAGEGAEGRGGEEDEGKKSEDAEPSAAKEEEEE